MSTTEWADAVEALMPFMFRIETPSGQGSGFFLTHAAGGMIGIATALHVDAESFEWNGPIRVRHYKTGIANVFGPDQREIKAFPENDLAFIRLSAKGFSLPQGPLGMVSGNNTVRQGTQIAWLDSPQSPRMICVSSPVTSARI